MDQFDFQETRYEQVDYNAPKNPFLVQLIIDLGLAKDAKSANIILLVSSLLFFAVSVYFFTTLGSPDVEPPRDFNPEDPFLLP